MTWKLLLIVLLAELEHTNECETNRHKEVIENEKNRHRESMTARLTDLVWATSTSDELVSVGEVLDELREVVEHAEA